MQSENISKSENIFKRENISNSKVFEPGGVSDAHFLTRSGEFAAPLPSKGIITDKDKMFMTLESDIYGAEKNRVGGICEG